MNNLKRLGAVVAFTFVLGAAAFAGETPTGPCAPPEPGETPTGPCASAPVSPKDSAPQGETQGPPAANAVDMLSVAETAMKLLLVF